MKKRLRKCINCKIQEETLGLVVRQKTHDQEVLGSNPPLRRPFSCTNYLGQIMETHLITWHCCMCCNPANGRVGFVDGWQIYLHQGCKRFVGGPRPKSNGRVKKYLGRRVPSSQVSLYRSPFANAKFTNLPLQIPRYRQMEKSCKIHCKHWFNSIIYYF